MKKYVNGINIIQKASQLSGLIEHHTSITEVMGSSSINLLSLYLSKLFIPVKAIFAVTILVYISTNKRLQDQRTEGGAKGWWQQKNSWLDALLMHTFIALWYYYCGYKNQRMLGQFPHEHYIPLGLLYGIGTVEQPKELGPVSFQIVPNALTKIL